MRGSGAEFLVRLLYRRARAAGIQWFDWVFGGSVSKVAHPVSIGWRPQGLPAGLLECPPDIHLAFLELSNPADGAERKPQVFL